MTQPEVMTRIRKLLDHSRGAGCTAEEAGTFLAKAREMMERHHIEEAELGRLDGVIMEHRVYDNQGEGIADGAPWPLWKRLLFEVAGRAMGLENLFVTLPKPGWHRLVWVGTKEDIEAAQYLFIVLARKVEDLCRTKCKGSCHMVSYRYGCLAAIEKQLSRHRSPEPAVSANAWALIHVKDAALKDHMANAYPNIKTFKRRTISVEERDYQQGVVDGGRIAVRPGLSREGRA